MAESLKVIRYILLNRKSKKIAMTKEENTDTF